MSKRETYNKKSNKNHNRRNSNSKCKTDDLRSKSNDPSWYATDSTLLRDSASIPFSWALGTTVPVGKKNEFRIPGLITFETFPTVGYSSDSTSPINIAATAVYGHVRYAQSGHSNYDAPDLMMYIVGMAEVYSYINYLMRLYGLATLYAQRNRYCARTLVEANRVDYDDLLRNLASFRYQINVLINKASSLAVPNNMSIFRRLAFLYQNLYCEGNSIKDQMYMYVPYAFHIFSETTPKGGRLQVQVMQDKYTVEQLIAFGNRMLDPILASEDMNIMSGDILRAYGENGILKLVQLGTDYTVVPLYDPVVLEQMHNSGSLWAAAWDSLNADIYQDPATGTILSDMVCDDAGAFEFPALYALYDYYSGSQIITTAVTDPTPEVVMENTRLKFSMEFKNKVGNNSYYKIYSGSDIVRQAKLWVLDAAGNPKSYLYTPGSHLMNYQTPADVQYIFIMEALLQQFSHRPLYPMHLYNSDDKTSKFVGMNGNIGNYASLTNIDLQRIHEAALMNMLHVPSIAKV